MKRQLPGLVLCILALTACGGRYTVPAQKDIPNPAIGGRVFGPELFPSCVRAQHARDAGKLTEAIELQTRCVDELMKGGVAP